MAGLGGDEPSAGGDRSGSPSDLLRQADLPHAHRRLVVAETRALPAPPPGAVVGRRGAHHWSVDGVALDWPCGTMVR